jgi:hypothetical protein
VRLHAEYLRDGQNPEYRDLVIAVPNRKLAEGQAKVHLDGAAKITVITLSRDELTKLGLQDGQVRK